MSKGYELNDIIAYIRSEESGLMLTNNSTMRAWDMITDPGMVTIQFPEPEEHWSFKWRMFKKQLIHNRITRFLQAVWWWLQEFPLWSKWINWGNREYE